ncbi:AraC family transcriptional regulator [Clostridium oryzae]|uniref:Melibiose operon regulatory protein n=1 Tax=Clostridium oryzae TaxID=1450648 RepID=A0A1V4IDL6_9CLOT|nr:AraC family transcriptional regulator [Clostridium oryzae]OPJ58043.1 melibiose operon regulatory protein [Clostridium oryzae]
MSIFNDENRYISIEAYYSVSFDSFHMSQHSHPSCEIMYVTKGICNVEVNNTILTLKQGQFIFIDENIPHLLCVNEGSPCSIINLEFACTTNRMGIDIMKLKTQFNTFLNFLQTPFEYISLYDRGTLCHALKDLLLELETYSIKQNQFVLEVLLMHILIELSRCTENNNSIAGLVYVRKAQQYIKDNLDKEISIQDIASYIGIHKTYLQKLFKQYQNCSISEYRNKIKLQKAAYLLQNTTSTITDIAFEVGYNSRQHFSYTFEKYYKISPKEYRQKNNFCADINTNGMKLIKSTNDKVYISTSKPF